MQVVRHGAAMGPLVLRAAADASLQKRGNASSALAEESPAGSAGTPGATELDELQAAAATWFGVVMSALTGRALPPPTAGAPGPHPA